MAPERPGRQLALDLLVALHPYGARLKCGHLRTTTARIFESSPMQICRVTWIVSLTF